VDEPGSIWTRANKLQQAIRGIRARGGIVIIISHRRSVLGEVDLLLAMVQGRVVAIGPREVVFQKLTRPASPVVEPFKLVPSAG
jgi:ATP-binding cassette subfamily C protein